MKNELHFNKEKENESVVELVLDGEDNMKQTNKAEESDGGLVHHQD